MRLLVLGGTVYVSRTIAGLAVDAGDEVVCLARGASGPPPEGARLVRADRSRPDAFADLDGDFDAVVDVSRKPSEVRAALDALDGRVGHWVFVSSGSVYADSTTPGQTVETSPLLPAAPPDVDEDDASTYGERKVTCELMCRDRLDADRLLISRPGLIVGPGDTNTDRFGYWVQRVAAGGEILAPGTPDRNVQWIDVRDLCEWLLRAARTKQAGTFDGLGPPVPMEQFLQGLAAALGTAPDFTWVDQDFLTEHAVEPWMGPGSLPMWLPSPEYDGFMSRDVRASLDAGLTTRPLADTATAYLAWLGENPDHALRAGIDADTERDLLAQWRTS